MSRRVLRAVHWRSASLHAGRPCRWLPKGKCQWFVLGPSWAFLLTSVPRHGICVVAGFRQGTLPLPGAAPAFLLERPSMAIRRRPASEETGKHLAKTETTLFSSLSSLVEHCSHRSYDDGTVREPGWITVKTSGAAWVVQVKDPDGCCSFSCIGETLDKALETAALLLACDEAPWEPDLWLQQARAKKKK